MSELIIYENSPTEHAVIFELTTPRILIGSSPDNELVLEAENIALAHASLENRYGDWILQDLGSSQGTKVNGEVVHTPHQLAHHDIIELGQIKLKFQADGLAETIPPPPPTEEVKGRVWLATVAVATVAVISIILLFLALAHYFHWLDISALFL